MSFGRYLILLLLTIILGLLVTLRGRDGPLMIILRRVRRLLPLLMAVRFRRLRLCRRLVGSRWR